ncbi:ABC transporter substrate-binding protein [Streptomyces sp. NPDC051016]|uniref:ABC transporter substrate-binding protein n=1 Tax=Streptomyces sp. NPDC051016 TaxID=3365638 RepID=UPI0037A76D11
MRRALPLAAKAVAPLSAAALLLTACTGQGADGSGAGAAGGSTKDKLVLGMTADITGWDPSAQPAYQAWGFEAAYDTLVSCNKDWSLAPAAAKSWEISADKKSFTAHLRSGMKFSDGTPVTAQTVKETFAPLAKTASDRYGGIKFDIPDAHTVTITWPDPQPLMNSRVCNPKLASAKYLASKDKNTAPVGSGPYTYDAKASTAGSVYVLKKNPDFYDAKKYPYKTLELRVLSSATAALNALKTGQIDGTVVTADTYNEAKQSANVNVMAIESGVTAMMLTDHEGKKIPALKDVRVRKAMNMVFDRDLIAKNLYKGLASPTYQFFNKKGAAYVKDAGDAYPYNVAQAKKLMKQAGYEKGFTLTLPTMEGQAWTVLLPYVTQQLAELNITVKTKTLTGADAISKLLSGDYPAPLWTVGASADSIQDISIGVIPAGYWNVSHQSDATVEKNWKTILTGSDSESRTAQQAIGKYVLDNAWYVPLVNPQVFYAYSDSVKIPKSTDPNDAHPLLRDFQ